MNTAEVIDSSAFDAAWTSNSRSHSQGIVAFGRLRMECHFEEVRYDNNLKAEFRLVSPCCSDSMRRSTVKGEVGVTCKSCKTRYSNVEDRTASVRLYFQTYSRQYTNREIAAFREVVSEWAEWAGGDVLTAEILFSEAWPALEAQLNLMERRGSANLLSVIGPAGSHPSDGLDLTTYLTR